MLIFIKLLKKVLSWVLPTLFILGLLAFGALEFYVWVIYQPPADNRGPLWIEFLKFHFDTLVPAA